MSDHAGDTLIYVGTYTQVLPHVHGRAEGVYLYRLDAAGALHHVSTAPGALNPSFLALDAGRRHLYAVEEVDQFAGVVGGGATAYAVDPASGALTPLGSQPTHGAHPCHALVARKFGTPEWIGALP